MALVVASAQGLSKKAAVEDAMTHVSLFSGIGGIDLAAHWAGFRTIQFVEREPFCQKVLAKNFPGVPIHDDVTTFNGGTVRGCTLLSGGFPCQDISQAGKQKGLSGERSGLWFEMLRVIVEARPAWVVAENVGALIRMGIDTCLAGLEAEGYTTRTVVFPSCGVGAVHRRERCFIIAHRTGEQGKRLLLSGLRPESGTSGESTTIAHRASESGDGGNNQPGCQVSESGNRDSKGNAFDANSERQQVVRSGELRKVSFTKQDSWREVTRSSALFACHEDGYTPIQSGDWRTWGVEPVIRRDANGLPNRVDRLRALGNAVVPQQVYPILKAIAEAI